MHQHDDQAISLAGKVLSRGNPFGEGEGARDTIAKLLPPEHQDFLMTRLSAFLSPFFEDALSLAGHVLSDEAHEHDPQEPTSEQLAAAVEAVTLFRQYEAHHRAQAGFPDADTARSYGLNREGVAEGLDRFEKAERNAAMAARLEQAFGITLLHHSSPPILDVDEILSAEVVEDDGDITVLGTTPLTASDIPELRPAERMLGLLKGQHPHGVTWAHLGLAIDYVEHLGAITPWAELRQRGLIREDDDGNVFATDAVVADPSILALPWPTKGGRL